jgi:hypothetical protein
MEQRIGCDENGVQKAGCGGFGKVIYYHRFRSTAFKKIHFREILRTFSKVLKIMRLN